MTIDKEYVYGLISAYKSYSELYEYIVEYKLNIFHFLENLSVLPIIKEDIKFSSKLHQFSDQSSDFQNMLNQVLEELGDEIQPIIDELDDYGINPDDEENDEF